MSTDNGPDDCGNPGPDVARRLEACSCPEPNTGCLLWTLSMAGEWRYGRIVIRQRHHQVHRVAWVLAHGPIPQHMRVLHKCDTPPCLNVEHLFLGTHDDNMADMSAKRRAKPFYQRVLSREQVLEIRRRFAAGETTHSIAKVIGCNSGIAWEVANGKTYRDIQ